MRSFRFSVVTVALVLLAAACDAYRPKPTPAQSFTPKPTTAPEATVGPLVSVAVERLGLAMLAPSTWGAPASLNENGIVLSPTGSNDTSSTAGPFLLVIADTSVFFHTRLNFREGLSDPVEQLNALLGAMRRDGPKFAAAAAYQGAKYPAAMTRGYERDNELTIVLMNAGDDRWIYVGAQAREAAFGYYEGTVFTPVTNSITLKAP